MYNLGLCELHKQKNESFQMYHPLRGEQEQRGWQFALVICGLPGGLSGIWVVVWIS